MRRCMPVELSGWFHSDRPVPGRGRRPAWQVRRARRSDVPLSRRLLAAAHSGPRTMRECPAVRGKLQARMPRRQRGDGSMRPAARPCAQSPLCVHRRLQFTAADPDTWCVRSESKLLRILSIHLSRWHDDDRALLRRGRPSRPCREARPAALRVFRELQSAAHDSHPAAATRDDLLPVRRSRQPMLRKTLGRSDAGVSRRVHHGGQRNLRPDGLLSGAESLHGRRRLRRRKRVYHRSLRCRRMRARLPVPRPRRLLSSGAAGAAQSHAPLKDNGTSPACDRCAGRTRMLQRSPSRERRLSAGQRVRSAIPSDTWLRKGLEWIRPRILRVSVLP